MVFNTTFYNISVTVYRGGQQTQLYWWRKPAYQEKTTDFSQVTDKLYSWFIRPYMFTVVASIGAHVIVSIFLCDRCIHRGSQLYFHITRYVLKRKIYLAMWKYNCEPLWVHISPIFWDRFVHTARCNRYNFFSVCQWLTAFHSCLEPLTNTIFVSNARLLTLRIEGRS